MNKLRFDILKQEYLDNLIRLENLCFNIPWSRNMFYNDISNPNAYYVIALDDNKVIGYCGVYKVLDEASITNIAVHPDHRKQGIATKILNIIIDHCIRNDMSFVTLEVRESNKNAINLYTKSGFVVVGQRKNYYSDNHETAILMTKYIKEV